MGVAPEKLTMTHSEAADAIEGDDGNGDFGLFAKDEVGINLDVELSSEMREGRIRTDVGELDRNGTLAITGGGSYSYASSSSISRCC
jgi:hypothetical protein